MTSTWVRWWVAVLMALPVWAGTPLPQTAFFVQNEGQWDGAFAFKYEGKGAAYFLTESGMTVDLHYPHLTSPTKWGKDFSRSRDAEADKGLKPLAPAVRGHVLRLSYVNANPIPILTGEDKLPSYSNYFLSRDSCKWRSRVGHYRSITAQDVWPGIDVQYRIATQGVETVYRVHPGANASLIQLRYEGQEGTLSLAGDGSLQILTSLGLVTEKAPFAYQNLNHTQIEVPCRYDLTAEGNYRFVLGLYDTTREVIIDPLVYSSYFGAGYGMLALAHDPQHNLLGVGDTFDGNFPVTPGAYQTVMVGTTDSYVAKFAPGGQDLFFCTFIGGSAYDGEGSGAVVSDRDGHVCVGGMTYSTDWPLTSDAFDSTFGGEYEGFFFMLSSDGATLEYSTYVGGAGRDRVSRAAMDSLSGDIYLAGQTEHESQSDFPLTPDAMYRQTVGAAGCVMIFDPHVHALLYSTIVPSEIDPSSLYVLGNRRVWLAGTASDSGLAVTDDAYQADFVSGMDGFLTRLDLFRGVVEYGSYFGGNDYDFMQMSLVGEDRVALFGWTFSTNFPPVTPGAFDTTRRLWDNLPDGYITILHLPATIEYSTILGGSGGDEVVAVHSTPSGDILALGNTASPDFPLTPNAMDTTYGWWDMFVCRLSGDLGHLLYGSRLGGDANDYVRTAVFDEGDSVWLAGSSSSRTFPVTPDAFQPVASAGYNNVMSRVAIDQGPDVAAKSNPLPQDFALSAFPNPFNPTTTLSFTLPAPSEVTLEVFDVLGRCVYQKELGRMSAGEQQYRFEGSELSSGVYFARLQAGRDVGVRKMIMLK
ncbi:MAG TPA: T9SS type A sorting domain-containing protein [bacterium]|jgi:hypothetical protein